MQPPGVCSATAHHQRERSAGFTVNRATCDFAIALAREHSHRRYLDTAVTGLHVKELRLAHRDCN
jgi:hypothetical protein